MCSLSAPLSTAGTLSRRHNVDSADPEAHHELGVSASLTQQCVQPVGRGAPVILDVVLWTCADWRVFSGC